MEDYEQINSQNPRYLEYWKAQRSLCNLAIEKKRQESFEIHQNDDHLFQIEELEQESELYLESLSIKDLLKMQTELDSNIKNN